jgi:L-seryl-tRNA(Ser) seleniumtransferase
MVVAVEDGNLELLSNRLRRQSPPIITRIQDEGLLIDPRTVLPGQEPALLSGVMNAIRQGD